MKKILTPLLTLLILLSAYQADAGKKKFFTGKITYSIDIQMDNLPEEARAMLPTTMVMYVGEHHIKTVLFTQMGKQISILDLKNKTKTTLLDMMGKKMAIITSTDEIRKELEQAPDYTVEKTDETREIAGLECIKILVKESDDQGNEEVVSTGWFTDAYHVNPEMNFDDPFYKDVEGLLLEFGIEARGGMHMQFSAKEIEEKKIKEKEFEVPDDYEIKTADEVKGMFGG